jgi:hypothetical protein
VPPVDEISKEQIYTVLKAIQADLTEICAMLAECTNEHLHIQNGVSSLRDGELRRETLLAQMNIRLERIEKHLKIEAAKVSR